MTRRGARKAPASVGISLLVLGVALGSSHPVPAQTPIPAGDPLVEARRCLKDGDYDRATEILGAATRDSSLSDDRLGQTYLALINTHVQRGNTYKDQPHGRATAELWYRQARQTMEECLALPRLHRLRPIPREDFPPEMVALFDSVRAERFGDLRIVRLEPPDAVVVVGRDTLRAPCDRCPLEARDLPRGAKTIRVTRPGYRTRLEPVTISPNSTLELSLALRKSRGFAWYALRAGSVAAAFTGYLVLFGDEKNGGTPEPLPGPPAPPR